MKFNDQSWETLIAQKEEQSYHKSIEKIVSFLPDSITQFPNLLVYGPEYSGKYSFVLYLLSKFSPSKLKYEKKILIDQVKMPDNYFIKMSDVHFEVDFNLLGCNGKQLWFTIFNQIIEIVSSNNKKEKFMIVCKNFHNINIETLEVFYSYLQKSFTPNNLGFILLTESYSFIPYCIKNLFVTIPISKIEYNKNSKQSNNKNITEEKLNKIVVDLCSMTSNKKKINFNDIRGKLYNLLIFNHSITTFVEQVTMYLILNKNLSNDQMDKLISINEKFLYFFQNNYRPIFHLESFFYSIVEILHES